MKIKIQPEVGAWFFVQLRWQRSAEDMVTSFYKLSRLIIETDIKQKVLEKLPDTF